MNEKIKYKRKKQEKEREIFIEEIVKSVRDDFNNRQLFRQPLELQWRLNMDFAAGRQFCYSSPTGEILEKDKSYFWESREVYNHIAPIVETRLSKLSRVRPVMNVRAASGDDHDLYIARLSSKILKGICNNINYPEIITNATMWSEICGTVFYKVVWNSQKGAELGEYENKKIYEGDAEITVCPPFEIYPDNLSAKNVNELRSIIHAKSMHVDDIQKIWGIAVEQEDVEVYNNAAIYASNNGNKQKLSDHALVIEKYEVPSINYPDGRLIIISGDKLLYNGVLPYINKKDCRGLPFIRQLSVRQAGCFFGTSLIERCIPVQRAYNSVKNRKHEFLNRIAMGVVAVEDGSVDTDSLEEEGLPPGKVVVYRQGSRPPQMMECGRVPNEFTYEEDRLLSEFVMISGVSEVMRNSGTPKSITSGVAISLLIEQDDTRLALTAENIREAVKETSQQILRVYKQFADTPRLIKVAGEDGSIDVIFFEKADICADDIVFETENELAETPAQRKNMILEMLKTGLLTDENGRLSAYTKSKILEQLGYGGVENTNQLTSLQIKRAALENFELITKGENPSNIDDHDLHISEHVKFVLSSEFNAKKYQSAKDKYFEHINAHKQFKNLERQAENLISG